MRTYGRVTDEFGVKTWVEVSTDSNGNNDMVWVTTLCQVLKLAPNESPFYANYGVPSLQSVMQQIYPDFYVVMTQRQFAQYFAKLVITRVQGTPDPVYNIDILTHSGVAINTSMQVPQ